MKIKSMHLCFFAPTNICKCTILHNLAMKSAMIMHASGDNDEATGVLENSFFTQPGRCRAAKTPKEFKDKVSATFIFSQSVAF